MPTGSDLEKSSLDRGCSPKLTGICVGVGELSTILELDEEVVIVLERGCGWCAGWLTICIDALGRLPCEEKGLSRGAGGMN